MIPPIEQKTGAQVHVGGITAIFEDFGDAIAEKLPLFIGVVVLLSALLLMIVFRSILVPLKAMVMNLLSIGAAFGLIVAVFQWGWGASLIGVDGTGPIISFFPIFLFAIVFGLSMDYEVFLMSRIHEEWEHSHDATEAVTRGLALTGRVITAAAAIMVTVFASFMLGEDRIIKLFGLGLASAVFIDAVIIRSVLVPAMMQLFGKSAWWLPRLARPDPAPAARGARRGRPSADGRAPRRRLSRLKAPPSSGRTRGGKRRNGGDDTLGSPHPAADARCRRSSSSSQDGADGARGRAWSACGHRPRQLRDVRIGGARLVCAPLLGRLRSSVASCRECEPLSSSARVAP